MDIIASFIKERHSGLNQRTPEWLAEKQFRIGGSSIATITGDNKYQTVASLIKGSSVKYVKRIYLDWGCLFEDVIKRFSEKKWNTTIVGDDIFILHKNDTAYSPDGLAVCDDEIVLFEFKCPYVRELTGSIPKHYKPQVLMGLDIIDIAKYGMYVEGSFKIWNAQDDDDTPAEAYGTISFFAEELTIEAFTSCEPINIGKSDYDLQRTLQQWGDKKLTARYSELSSSSPPNWEDGCCAYLQWKLDDFGAHRVEKISGYLDPYYAKILDVTSAMRKHATNMEKKLASLPFDEESMTI